MMAMAGTTRPISNDVLRSVIGGEKSIVSDKQGSNKSIVPLEKETKALQVRDEIKELENFIDEWDNNDEMKAIQLYNDMSLELRAEVSFLRKLNQATLLQDVSKNQANNSLLRDEIMHLRNELRAKNGLIKLLCASSSCAEAPDKDLLLTGSTKMIGEGSPKGSLTDSGYSSPKPNAFPQGNTYTYTNTFSMMSDNVVDRGDTMDKPEGKIEVIGDFMLNNIQLRELNKIHNVKINFIFGCMTYDIVNHVRKVLPGNVLKIVVHVGTNDVSENLDVMKNVKKITEFVKEKSPETELVFSSIIMRKDRAILADRITRANRELFKHCEDHSLGYIDNSNITETSLDVSRVHLNKKGNSLLGRNILDQILDD